MQRQKLKVEKRTIIGKKVKKLRREGILPANVYGKDVKSVAVQIPFKDFEKIFKEVGETGLVDLEVDGEIRPVLIHNVQHDYLTHVPVHADLYQVNLKEKVRTMVPLVIVGEPKAVVDKLGILLQQLSAIEVEALPTDLPENIEVNVEPLAAVDAQITVGKIKTPAGVEILTDAGQVVVKIGELITKEAAEEAAKAAAAAEAAKVEVAEEAAPAEGAPTEVAPGPAKPEAAKPQEASKEEAK